MNEETLKRLREKVLGDSEKEGLSKNICRKFGQVYNLYGYATEKLLGKRVSVYDRDLKEMLEVLKPKYVKFEVKEHGYGLVFFMSYKKGWFKKIEYYHILGYSLFALRDESSLNKFTINDLKLIIEDLDNVILELEAISNKGSV